MSTVIVGMSRTPVGSFLGSLSELSAPKLGSFAIKEALQRASIAVETVDEVIMGQVLQAGVGQAPARQASLFAGLLAKTPCTTVNKVCGSGLKAIMVADQVLRLDDAKVVVAGGMESMSNAPYVMHKARKGFRMGDQKLFDAMIHDGLWDPYGQAHMGNFGDLCAHEYKISREEQDLFAKQSYEKAINAQKSGVFIDEIVPVTLEQKGSVYTVNEDEEPKNFKPEKMTSLKGAFGPDGSVTAANASKVNDGAAAVVLMREEEARAQGKKILGRIVAQATFAHDPSWFTSAPVEAIQKVLQQAKMKIDDVDLFEINEAFAVVPLLCMRKLKIDENIVNIHGGAISLGHPIGCSGARIVVTLLNALVKKNKSIGCIAVCLGGGEAVSMIIERV